MTSNAKELAKALLAQTTALDATRMRVVFETYLESWRTKDQNARAALFSDAAILEDPVGGPILEGKPAICDFWLMGDQSGYSFDPRLELFIVGGHECLVRFVMRMSKVGEASLDFTIHEIVNFDAEYHITSLRAFWNDHSVAPVQPA